MWNTNTLSLWKYLIGLSAEAIYGGRIDNDQDLCVLMSYLEQYFSDTILSIRWKPFNVNISLPTNSRYEVNTFYSRNNAKVIREQCFRITLKLSANYPTEICHRTLD